MAQLGRARGFGENKSGFVNRLLTRQFDQPPGFLIYFQILARFLGKKRQEIDFNLRFTDAAVFLCQFSREAP